MRRLLAHLLLSAALIFQGMGAACATGPMPSDMGNPMTVAAGMADASATCMTSHACPGCPGDHMSAQACMQSCGLPASVPSVAFSVPHVPQGLALAPPSNVSLVDYLQAPPTPPPIA